MSGLGPGHASLAARAAVSLVERPDAPLPWAASTDPGPIRPHNEDRWCVDDVHGVLALADGMGGYNAGEVAAEIAVRTVAQLVGALLDAGLAADDALARAAAAAHAGVVEFAHARPECLGMGTTLAAAALGGDRLVVAHVGDSRAYRWRDGRLERLTVDHSIGQRLLDEGRLNAAQVRRLPARGILTRALGVDGETPTVDLSAHDWRAGDLLLLCTDGLTDSLDDAALAAAIVPGLALGTLARDLIGAALARGCTDNLTVLVAGGAQVPPLAH
jgi:protein phosphatase